MPDSRIYLDNAATTPLDERVLEAMMPFLTTQFGNPSSLYSYGREAKVAVEKARKTVAQILGAQPGEIFFTGGGTETANTVLNGAVFSLGCKHIITSPIEHHATLHTVAHLHSLHHIKTSYVSVCANGQIDLRHLEELLSQSTEKCVVALLHANNEIGTLLNLEEAGAICQKYNAVFFSDTVQSVAHFPFQLQNLPVHFISGSAHKFHGPKGVGLMYIHHSLQITPYLHGGAQERNMRAGTENVAGIIGFAKALEIATHNYEEDKKYISNLKQYMAKQLQEHFPEVTFNGDSSENGLYTVLSVNFPKNEKTELLLFQLDINNICVSGGSACSSGAAQGSHVIQALLPNEPITTVRFSFSRLNTKTEIDCVMKTLHNLL
jgi:cysteine desulfurase